jgi:hypothetical protein
MTALQAFRAQCVPGASVRFYFNGDDRGDRTVKEWRSRDVIFQTARGPSYLTQPKASEITWDGDRRFQLIYKDSADKLVYRFEGKPEVPTDDPKQGKLF